MKLTVYSFVVYACLVIVAAYVYSFITVSA